MDLPEPMSEAEMEEDCHKQPSFNVGQRVVWLVGILHTPGTVVKVTKITQELSGKWFLQINGGGKVYPGRVIPRWFDDSDPSPEEMKPISS